MSTRLEHTLRWSAIARPRAEVEAMRAELRAIYAEVDALLEGFSCDASTECCRFGITGREPYPTAVELAELFDAIAARGLSLGRGGGKRPAKGGAKERGSGAHRREGGEERGRTPRRLPLAPIDERVCPLLDDGRGARPAGAPEPARCRVYASRPFGCRTFFCDRATGPGKVPRAAIQELSRRLADLSARAFPADPRPRPLSRALPGGDAC